MRTIVKEVAIPVASLLLVGATPLADVAVQTAPAPPSTPGQTEVASGKEVRALIAAMLAEMKPGQSFLWRPLVRDGATVAAIEIWKKPGRPAVHPAEAEYAIVLEGAGTLVSGGSMADPKVSNANLIEGSRIDGGATRPLGPGDVILIPAGVPHWFGITGDRLVLLGIKLPGAK